MMKCFGKIMLNLFLLAGALGVFAGRTEAQQIRVITTIPDLADMTKQIGKELVDVESLTRGRLGGAAPAVDHGVDALYGDSSNHRISS